MFVAESLEPLEWLDDDVEFLANFIVKESKKNEFISANKRTPDSI